MWVLLCGTEIFSAKSVAYIHRYATAMNYNHHRPTEIPTDR